MQLSLVGTHGSRTVRAGFPGFACSARAVLMVIAMSASPQRRRSMPISKAISAARASPVAGPSGRSASIGRHWTGSEQLLRYWIQAPDSRVVEDLRDSLLEARCHDVDSADSRDLEYLPGDLRADPQSLVGDPTGRHAAEPARDFVGDMHTGHDGTHMLQGPQRADRPHAGQDSAAPVQPQVADLGHPLRESGDIEDELRLHELRARGHFLAEPGGAETGRRGGWVLHGAYQPPRRRGQVPA